LTLISFFGYTICIFGLHILIPGLPKIGWSPWLQYVLLTLTPTLLLTSTT